MPGRSHSGLLLFLIYAAAVALLTAGAVMVLQPAGGSAVAAPMAMLRMGFSCGTVPAWTYGGEANETIRFMERLPDEAPHEVFLSREAELWLQQVEEERWLVEELPFVKQDSVSFTTSDTKTNDNKVQATVSCWLGQKPAVVQAGQGCL